MMSPQRKLIVTCVLAVASVGLLIWAVKPRHSPLGKQAGATLTVCAACGHEEACTLRSVPDTCPSCHKQQVYPAVKCPNCGAATPLTTMGGPQGRQPLLTCRSCGRQFAPQQSLARDRSRVGGSRSKEPIR